MAVDPALVGLRARTGAAIRDCIEALRACDGDADRAAASLARAAVSAIVATVGCPSEHAEAAHARSGWDVERACIEARRTWFAAEPAAEIVDVRSWRCRTLETAERFAALLPLVYQANIRLSPIGADISALSGLEDVLRNDKPLFEDWELYSSNQWGMRDKASVALERHEAGELLAVLERGRWSLGVDAAAALVHLPSLLERVKAALATVLEISRDG